MLAFLNHASKEQLKANALLDCILQCLLALPAKPTTKEDTNENRMRISNEKVFDS